MFSSHGTRVFFTYSGSRKRALRLEEKLKGQGLSVNAGKADVASRKDIERLVGEIKERFGYLDIIVNNAGVIVGKSLADYRLSEIDSVFNVNIMGMIKATKLLLPLLAKASSIVNMSSTSAFSGSYDPVYAAAKGAVVSFTKSLARELGPDTRVNAVAPGLTRDTGMYRQMKQNHAELHRKKSLLKKLADPGEVASVVLFLCSDAASHITGAW